MKITDIIQYLETVAPPVLQEGYDNAGLLTGNKNWECSGVLCTLDATEKVVEEAVAKGLNLIVAHHPIIFSGLKKITGNNYVERTIIAAIKNDIAIYAIHTNLDNVLHGVNGKIADKLGLVNRQVLAAKNNMLQKMVVFVPNHHSEKVKEAIFAAGGGNIGNYSECCFDVPGTGSFKASEGAQPYIGQIGHRHTGPETRVEVIFPAWLQQPIVQQVKMAHPYEEVAYDLYPLNNTLSFIGSGVIGQLLQPVTETAFLAFIKKQFGLHIIRHTPLLGKPVNRVAICGGAGSFLTKTAIAHGADIFITADVKYHEFFDADAKIVIADIGHWESEQFTVELLFDVLISKFTTFAVQKSDVVTNPVSFFK